MRAWAIKFKSGYLSCDGNYDILTAAHLYLNKESAEDELDTVDEHVVEVEIKEKNDERQN